MHIVSWALIGFAVAYYWPQVGNATIGKIIPRAA
jgi:hypothetical protein